METPEGLIYTEEHEWIRMEGSVAVVGVTDYAQGELGDIVFVELPETGEELESGGVFGTIEAVKTVSDLYAPISGKVVEVNHTLGDAPESVNTSPYGDGWMIKIEAADVSELDKLMDATGYRSHVGEG